MDKSQIHRQIKYNVLASKIVVKSQAIAERILFGLLPSSNSKDYKMPPSKDYTAKQANGRSMSTSGMSIQARVYHPATNLMPPTPPLSPTGIAPSFSSSSIKSNSNSWSRQNSQNGHKYS